MYRDNIWDHFNRSLQNDFKETIQGLIPNGSPTPLRRIPSFCLSKIIFAALTLFNRTIPKNFSFKRKHFRKQQVCTINKYFVSQIQLRCIRQAINALPCAKPLCKCMVIGSKHHSQLNLVILAIEDYICHSIQKKSSRSIAEYRTWQRPFFYR